MTLTLEVRPETEARLRELAVRRGVNVSAVVDELAADAIIVPGPSASRGSGPSATAAQPLVLHGYGKFAGRSRTVDDFLRERHAEAATEMQKAQMQQAAQRDHRSTPLQGEVQGEGRGEQAA